MDTNMSQALKIAGGLLIALVLISALVYFFGLLAPMQIALDDIKVFEQTADFNKEFEVYNKDIMYGLDVISAINKAASYNKTYIDAYENLNASEFDYLKDNYLVDVELTLNTNVEEKLQIYYTNSVVGEKKELEYLTGNFSIGPFVVNENIILAGRELRFDEDIFNKIFDDPLEENVPVRKNTLINRQPYTILGSGGYSLIENNPATKYCNQDLYNVIIKDSVKPQIVIKNNQPNYLIGEWTKAVYTTGVYDFKSKKFRCTGVDYSEITGRIINLTFAEI